MQRICLLHLLTQESEIFKTLGVILVNFSDHNPVETTVLLHLLEKWDTDLYLWYYYSYNINELFYGINETET